MTPSRFARCELRRYTRTARSFELVCVILTIAALAGIFAGEWLASLVLGRLF